MKRKIWLLAWLPILFIFVVGATRITVTKDEDGYMSRVTGYVLESGETVWEVPSDMGSGVSAQWDYISGTSAEYKELYVDAPSGVTADYSIYLGDTSAVTQYAVPGGTSYYRVCTSLASDISAIGSTEMTLIVADTQTVSANVTTPSTLTIKVLQGGGFSVDATKTLTINGVLDAGKYTIFSGSGTVDGYPKCSVVYPEWWGGRPDSGTTSSAAINSALSLAKDNGQIVELSGGTYIVGSGLTVYNRSKLVGQGHEKTILYLGNNVNEDIITSYGFATLTGNDYWLTADGVVNGFEIKGMTLNGNTDNNASGMGMKFFAKRYIINDVMIINTDETGFYSEAGVASGQTDESDMPESEIGPLWIRNCGDTTSDHGFHYRGPHDGHINALSVGVCGGIGAYFDTASNHSGICDIDFIHSYTNGQEGVYSTAWINANEIISENNVKEGLVLSGTSAARSSIRYVNLFENDRSATTSYYQCRIAATRTNIGYLAAKTGYASAGGVTVPPEGYYSSISDSYIDGVGNGGFGANIDANGFQFNGNITGFSTNGTGLRTNATTGNNLVQIKAVIRDCETLWENVYESDRCQYDIVGYAASGQTRFGGYGPNDDVMRKDFFNVTMLSASDNITYSTETSGVSTITNGTTWTEVQHFLITSPQTRDIQITPIETLNNADFWWVELIGTGTTGFRIHVDQDPGQDVDFAWKAKL